MKENFRNHNSQIYVVPKTIPPPVPFIPIPFAILWIEQTAELFLHRAVEQAAAGPVQYAGRLRVHGRHGNRYQGQVGGEAFVRRRAQDTVRYR